MFVICNIQDTFITRICTQLFHVPRHQISPAHTNATEKTPRVDHLNFSIEILHFPSCVLPYSLQSSSHFVQRNVASGNQAISFPSNRKLGLSDKPDGGGREIL
jgi:hypothetical protein